MANKSGTAVATAAGVALAAGMLGLAMAPARDTARVMAAAKQVPADPAVELGLAGPVSLARALCFDPTTPPTPQQMAEINALLASENNTDYNLGQGSWSGQAGTPPATLTWSLVPDGTQVPGLSTGTSASTLFASMDAKFGGNRTLWISQIQSCLDRWGALTGVNYQRVTNNGNDWDDGAVFPNAAGSNTPGATRGMIRIGMRVLDGINGVLAFDYYPTTSDMVIDSSENWQSSSSNYRFLRNTLTHEFGHGLGLAHVCPGNSTKLMEPLLATAFDGPQQDDTRGVHQLYGDQYEPNSTAAAATNLGSITFGTTYNPSTVPAPAITNGSITSIDRLADSDYFKFTVSAAALLNATLTPRGSTYLSGPQNSNGSCSAGTNVNSLTAATLSMQVLGTNGTTVLATAPAQPAGSAQSVTGVTLPAPGTYYIKIGASAVTSPQLYSLSFSAGSTTTCPQFTDQPQDQTLCEGGTIILYANATGAPTPTFQWRLNGLPLAGRTQTTLIIANADSGDQGDYDCVATNSCGTGTSDIATVTVNAAPSFSQQPQSQTVPVGGTAIFEVQAGPASISYQWTHNDQPVAGAVGPTLQISPVQQSDAGNYACIIENNCNSAQSDYAVLTVGGAAPCYANCDGSTSAPVLNVLDFNCFLNRFSAGDAYANCDGSTVVPVLNVLDFNCFLNRFTAGCP
jgi:hypothetical protein